MKKKSLNPLIEKKLAEVVHDTNTKKFILEILDIERNPRPRGKTTSYEKALEKFSPRSDTN